MRKRKITLTYQTTEKGFLGIPRTVTKKKVVEVDSKLYEKLKRQEESKKKQSPAARTNQKHSSPKHKPYTLEEMIFYDDLFDE